MAAFSRVYVRVARFVILCLTTATCIGLAQAKVYLCGDSTMAKDGGEYVGWGEYLGPVFQEDSFNVQVENDAIGGRSARTFTTEGRFNSTAAKVTHGDYVVIQFGWNDGAGKPDRVDCEPTSSGGAETVCSGGLLTFQAYMTNAAKLMQNKGASVIIASQTCPSPPASERPPGKFADWSKEVASNVNATFIDHYSLMQTYWKRYDTSFVQSCYVGSVHFNPKGAKIAAEVFAKAFESVVSGGSTGKGTDKQTPGTQTQTTTTQQTFQNGTNHGDTLSNTKKPKQPSSPPNSWWSWATSSHMNRSRLAVRSPAL